MPVIRTGDVNAVHVFERRETVVVWRVDGARVEFALECFNAISWSHGLCVCVSVA